MKFVSFLFVIASMLLKCHCFQSNSYIRIDGLKYDGNNNEIIYRSRIVLSSLSTLVISINGINYSNFGYTIFQTHCLHHNISINIESNFGETLSQYGTNIGFLLRTSDARKVFRLINNKFDDVHCLIALIAYKKSAPIPGRCEKEIKATNIEMLQLIEEENILTAIIPQAKEASNSCDESKLIYETYYTYLDILNFGADTYFDGIEKMMFNDIQESYKTKHVPLPDRHILETIPGRGLIINTVVRAADGEVTYYIPVATYSCPVNTWSAHCTDSNFIKRGISILLIVHSIVMILNLMSPEFIEAILNGMLFGGFSTILFIKSYRFEMQAFDYFVMIIIGACFMSALFGTITLYIPMGRCMSKVTFSAFSIIFTMEILFNSIISAYLQLILTAIMSIILSFTPFTFSAFSGSLILILNFSFLSKIGNLHRIVVNNFLAITTIPDGQTNESYFDFIRPNYINYGISLNFIDYGLIFFYFVISIYLTLRKEKFFFGHPKIVQNENIFSDPANIRSYNCEVAKRRKDQCIIGIRRTNQRGGYRVISRCRRHLHFRSNLINERSPLISHWLTGSDDEIFETPPETSSNVRITITDGSEENLESIKTQATDTEDS